MQDLSGFMEQVRRRRRELGLSQETLARQIGISTPYLCQLERGQKENPTLQVVMALAKTLNLPLDPHAAPPVESPSVPEPQRMRADIERCIALQGVEARRQLMAYTPSARVTWVINRILHQRIMSRIALAEQLHLTERGLSDLLERRTTPNPLVIQRLCTLTGIPLDFVYKGLLKWHQVDPPATELAELQTLVQDLLFSGIAPGRIRDALKALR